MTQKKTPEELELATHNRLKGTISYHIASAQSQLGCINRMLIKYQEGLTTGSEYLALKDVQTVLGNIIVAVDKFGSFTRSRLSIRNSPSSYRNKLPKKKSSLYKKPPYGTRK